MEIAAVFVLSENDVKNTIAAVPCNIAFLQGKKIGCFHAKSD